MAILYGTTGDGTTLPVLVDQFGNLLAKGIDGEPGTPGTPGPEGPPGADGGSFPLPPDPYEGAFLGWLNNELAWVGAPPVPIPAGRFGPIIDWDSQGLLQVQGEIPAEVSAGVYVYQCNQDGTIYVEGWNNSNLWSANFTTDYSSNSKTGKELFDGSLTTSYGLPSSNGNGKYGEFTNIGLTGISKLELYALTGATGGTGRLFINDVDYTGLLTTTAKWIEIPETQLQKIRVTKGTSGFDPGLYAFRANNQLVVDSGDYPIAPNLNFRVNSINNNVLIGVPNRVDNFTIGKYLQIPQQNVARWVYDDNLSKVITSTGIDFSRLTGN